MKKRVYNRLDNKKVVKEELIHHEEIIQEEWEQAYAEWGEYESDWVLDMEENFRGSVYDSLEDEGLYSGYDDSYFMRSLYDDSF